MKALHAITDDMAPFYQAAWAVHSILDGDRIIRYEFRRRGTGGMQYRRYGSLDWSTLSSSDVEGFNKPDELNRRGRYESNIKDFFVETAS